MQPYKDGPYQRALEKRGPGLHHLACVTDHLESAVEYFAKQGLLLHPISLTTHPKGTVWMCRPRIPFLLELYQSSDPIPENGADVFIDLPRSAMAMPSIEFIPNTIIRSADDSHIKISSSDQALSIDL
jgi:hypothetical protein